MASDINTRSARQLRQAMSKVGDKQDVSGDSRTIWGDEVEICAPLSGGPNDAKQLVIKRQGETVAAIMVTMGTIKRLREEMQWWKQVHSGAMKAFRYGNHP